MMGRAMAKLQLWERACRFDQNLTTWKCLTKQYCITSCTHTISQQLSNASSPAESVVSTSSNPGHSLGSSGASSRFLSAYLFYRLFGKILITSLTNYRTGKREKRGRGKKGRPGSKNGSSRGSTPPLMEWMWSEIQIHCGMDLLVLLKKKSPIPRYYLQSTIYPCHEWIPLSNT